MVIILGNINLCMASLTIKYTIFALLATAINLGVQRLVGTVYVGPLDYWVALFGGTLAGLVVKYILDKKYIFYYKVQNRREDSKKFVLYSIMGLATTAIFWGFQTGFYVAFPSFGDAKYIGAVIGLAIGYFTKYQLDKRFVFQTRELSEMVVPV